MTTTIFLWLIKNISVQNYHFEIPASFTEMKAQLMSAELKNKRLMEAFKKTSQEIREVCYQLTGYRIDIPTSNQYRLTSMYAESPNDYLLFQVSIYTCQLWQF